MTPIQRVLHELRDSVRPTGPDKWQARCPAHDDENPSLSIGLGDDGQVLLYCHTQRCSFEAIADALGIPVPELFPNGKPGRGRGKVTTYDYRDLNGELLFQVCRTACKGFWQRRPDGHGGWINNMDGVRRVLYRLPELDDADREVTVYIVEGEKDVNRLRQLGLVATCNPGGAGKWQHVDDEPLVDRPLVLIPDNDKSGRDHVQKVAAALHGRAASVKVLDPLIEKRGGDVSDWLDAGNDVEDLGRLAEQAAEWVPGPTPADAGSDDEHHLTELGNAGRLVDQHGTKLRYCDPWGKWFVWDGKRWKADDERRIEALAVETVRSILNEAAKAPDRKKSRALSAWAYSSETRHAVAAMLDLARHKLPVTPNQLDLDPWLVNVKNGTLDLRTGELWNHRPEDFITKLAPVEYHADAECPQWLEFLKRIMADDESLIGYLQRLLGMCLTGDVSVQEMFIFWGVGANGKSTLLDTIIPLMGDYACIAPPNLLTAKGRDEHPTEVADLFGKRLVVASETDEGRRLRTSLVKQVTGDRQLKGRFMRKDFFQFDRTHKTVLVTNNKPVVRESTKAIWRRLRLVPFDVVIPEAEQKLRLVDELLAEWTGIMRWLVQGCLSWKRDGLGAPEAVTVATEEYRSEQDQFQQFVDESCQIGVDLFVTRGDLWRAFQDWAQRVGENRPLGRNHIYEVLRAAGHSEGWETVAGKRTRVFRGIGLRHDDDVHNCTGRNNDS